MATMKAIRLQQYGGPEQLRYEDAPVPDTAAGQVLVRVRAASVNPWDLKLASGAFRDAIPMPLPYAPGSDYSGTVERVGAGASGVNVGDEVYGNCPHGSYAQYVAAPARTMAPKPRKRTHVESAAVPVAAQTAWQGLLEDGQLQRGQSVLIHAASGGVGTFAVQIARWTGARIYATASGENAESVRLLGADVVIDYKAKRFEDVAKDVDLVLDLIGGETQARSFAVLKPRGRLISTVSPPSQDEAKRRGVTAMMMQMHATRERLMRIAGLLDEGTITSIMTKVLPLEQAAEAWRLSKSGHARGKIVLEVA
jgi:NADPH:quinone reductase-like Zn-dependent oxidoreductase